MLYALIFIASVLLADVQNKKPVDPAEVAGNQPIVVIKRVVAAAEG